MVADLWGESDGESSLDHAFVPIPVQAPSSDVLSVMDIWTDPMKEPAARQATRPPLECDLVMKGGITSGVVYPLAVCELAEVYRLRCVGGSSAGAIAAAAAACAELGRDNGGFDKLAQLPNGLTETVQGQNSRLFTLFQPQPTMRRLFTTGTAGLGTPGGARLRAIAGAALRSWWGNAAAGAALGLAIIVGGFILGGPAQWASLLAGLLIAVVGLMAGVVVGLYQDLRALPTAGFGLCSGAGDRNAEEPALTPWLHETLQHLAGRSVDDFPVTFGDLDEAGITLRLMTTNLSRRQPMAMPWTEQGYHFDAREFRALFPESVVAAMENSADAPTTAEEPWFSAVRNFQRAPLVPFSAGKDLPILVAVRMSLSFPGLITAVPLHTVDHSRAENIRQVAALRAWREDHPDATSQEGAAAVPGLTLQRNWFSDGGICANLPLHFFDSALPRRPTFAINLASFPPGWDQDVGELDKSFLPASNGGGLPRRQSRWAPEGIGALKEFALSIVETARTWVDEGQQFIPGYRDRIVTIFTSPHEGGMNLNMTEKSVLSLSERGRGAAQRLVTTFAGDKPGRVPTEGWDNHRWIRFRTLMAALSEMLVSLRAGFESHPPGTTPYREWVGVIDDCDADGPLPSYPVEGDRRAAVNKRTQGLVETAQRWQDETGDAFTHEAPEPRPKMRLVPAD